MGVIGITITPSGNQTKFPNEECQFNAEVFTDDDTKPNVSWNVSRVFDSGSESSSGTDTVITNTGKLTIGKNENDGTFEVKATVNDGGTSVSKSVTVKVTHVKIIPSDVQMKLVGEKIQFKAEVFESNTPSVTWAVTGKNDNATNISTKGLLTIGDEETNSLTVTATVDGTSVSNSVTVIVSKKSPDSESAIKSLGDWIAAYLESNPDNTPQQALAAMVPNVATGQTNQDLANRKLRASKASDICYSNYKWGIFNISGMAFSETNVALSATLAGVASTIAVSKGGWNVLKTSGRGFKKSDDGASLETSGVKGWVNGMFVG